MAVDPGAAVARDVLEDRQHAAGEQPLAHRPAEASDAVGLGAIGAVADHRIGAGAGQVEHRQAVDGDAEPSQIVGDQAGAEPGRLGGVRIGQRGDPRRRRIAAPMRRPQPRHPAAFLVDQHRRRGPPDASRNASTSPRT